MRAAVFHRFQGPLEVTSVADPTPLPDGAILAVKACGICRSDWHGWMGHDPDIHLPHVPGHELSGEVQAVGADVKRWRVGQRVTVPFCCGCGICDQCRSGNEQICDNYTQPGFTHWGGFADFVQIRHADINLVTLPDSVDFVTAASLGCRFATSFRAVIQQGRVRSEDVVAIHGCGGVGLSAVMIAASLGARVIAVDISTRRLELAAACGAETLINATDTHDVVDVICGLTRGGAGVSIDALGSHETCLNSVQCLRKRGRHVQVGLTLGNQANPPIPMSTVVARELELCGSHGMSAAAYPQMLAMIESQALRPELLITDRVSLSDAAGILPRMDDYPGDGTIVMDTFL